MQLPRASFLALAALAITGRSSASTDFSEQIPPAASSTDVGIAFPISAADFDAYAGLGQLDLSAVTLEPGVVVDLRLTQQEAFAPAATLVVAQADGERALPRPPVALFSGEVIGNDDGLAFLSIAPFGVQGFVRLASTTYVISSGPYGQQNATLVFNLTTLPAGAIDWSDFQCGVGDLPLVPGAQAASGRGRGATRGGPPCRVANVAFETDTEYLDKFGGNVTYASAYVATLTTGITTIYRRDVNTRIAISYLRLWDVDDPWTQPDTLSQLYEFQDYWNANMGDVSRTVVHFLTPRYLGGGIAYLSALCAPGYDYGLSANLAGHFPYPLLDHNSGNWDIMVTSHELGHNFGAPHTHDTTPPIDGCGLGDCSQAWGGTIMSYCHTCSGGMSNMVLDLHERIESEYILPFLESEQTCDMLDVIQVNSQPSDAAVCAFTPVTFSISVTSGNLLTYQWTRDGVPIQYGTTASYTIPAPTTSDAATYNVTVLDSCSAVTSQDAVLTILAAADCPVPGDVDGDRHVGLDDLAALLAAYGSKTGDANFNPAADVVQDGYINLSDLAALLNFFGA